MHQGEGEPFPAQVLQRGSDVVHLIIYQQKAVVGTVEVLHNNRRVLRIVAVYVLLELLAMMYGQRNLFSL